MWTFQVPGYCAAVSYSVLPAAVDNNKVGVVSYGTGQHGQNWASHLDWTRFEMSICRHPAGFPAISSVEFI